jgi:hypothetical protein
MNDPERQAVTTRKVLLLVSELHLRGLQLLRACMMMNSSGTSWRCSIAPVSLVSIDNGALLVHAGWDSPLVAHYTSAAGDEYFGWTDAAHDTPSALARKFIERFPDAVEAGRGSDWLYAGWYVEMLHLTYPHHFPYAMADWETPDDYMDTVSPVSSVGVKVPLPPPGRAQNEKNW